MIPLLLSKPPFLPSWYGNNEASVLKRTSVSQCGLVWDVGGDGMGWDGMGWDGMGWDGMDQPGADSHLLLAPHRSTAGQGAPLNTSACR